MRSCAFPPDTLIIDEKYAGFMSLEEEKLLPRELRNKQLKSTGNIRAWKYEDIPQVVKSCRELRMAIYGAQTEFFLPDATCDLYWKKANPKLKTTDENWQQYAERSCADFLVLFRELVDTTDFKKEGIHSFYILRDKDKAGVNILDYLCFRVDIISESRYLKYFLDNY